MKRGVTVKLKLSCLTARCLLALPLLQLAACGGMQIRPVDHMPVPLVEKLPLSAGLHMDAEFRSYVYKETRWNSEWMVALGAPSVSHATRVVAASFRSVREVKDPKATGLPAVDLVLSPHVEEFAFVTPRDAGGVTYQVTLRYRMNVFNPQGQLIDSLLYTGYGAVAGGGISTEAPLTLATEAALRDAGAKFLTEFPQQPVVQQLLRGETPAVVPEVAHAAVPTAVPAAVPTAVPAAAPMAVPATVPLPVVEPPKEIP
jgi:hypothetical protein